MTLLTQDPSVDVRMARAKQPWWYAARFPYRYLMILFAIRSKESLSHVARTFGDLTIVASLFPTPSMVTALTEARKHVDLWHHLSRYTSSVNSDSDPRELEYPKLVPGWELRSLGDIKELKAWMLHSWIPYLGSNQTLLENFSVSHLEDLYY